MSAETDLAKRRVCTHRLSSSNAKYRQSAVAQAVCGGRRQNSRRPGLYQRTQTVRTGSQSPTSRRPDRKDRHRRLQLQLCEPCNCLPQLSEQRLWRGRAYRFFNAMTVISWATCCHAPTMSVTPAICRSSICWRPGRVIQNENAEASSGANRKKDRIIPIVDCGYLHHRRRSRFRCVITSELTKRPSGSITPASSTPSRAISVCTGIGSPVSGPG